MVIAAAAAFVVSAAGQPLVISQLRRHRLLDTPNQRSSHDVPTPRGGGMAVGVGLTAGLVLALSGSTLAGWLTVALTFSLLGLVEDVRGLPVTVRAVAQAGAAVLACMLVVPSATVLMSLVVVTWVVACVNAANFMDGANGLSALNGIAMLLAYAAVAVATDALTLAVVAVTAAAAMAGFLPWNIVRPRVFLGDVGSYLLGAVTAVLAAALFVEFDAPLEAVAFPLSLYAADTATTLVRRVARGERWYEAHRSHVYQRLLAHGWSHVQVASITAMTTALLSLLGMASLTGDSSLRGLADVTALAVLLGYLTLPAVLRTRQPAGATV